MEKIELFKANKIISMVIGLFGLALILLYVLSFFTDYEIGDTFPFLGFMLFFQMIVQFKNFNKYFIHFDQKHINWYLPSMTEPKSIALTDTTFEFSKDWKGLSIINGTDKVEISTDGLWDRDKNLIYEKLEEYYAK